MCKSFFSHANNPSLVNVGKDIHIRKGANMIEVKQGNQTLFSFHPRVLKGLVNYVLVGPTEGEKGPFLVTVWGKGASSHIALVFDLSRAKNGIAAHDVLVHSYISAHNIRLSNRQKLLTQLEIRGHSYEVDKRAMDYREETITCQWSYKPGTTNLDCTGP